MILKIKGQKIDFFNEFEMSMKYDAIASTFSCLFYFDPANGKISELAHVGHYHKMTVEHNDETLITGYILSQSFNDGPVKTLASLGGYSLSGVLEDCEIPTSLYPLQSDGLSLREIAQKLIAPFGLSMVIDSSVSSKMDEVYDTSTANVSQTVKGYLCELASQKNIIVGHTSGGALLFTKASTGKKPILHLERGIPGTKMSLSFNGQGMHSSITVVKEPGEDGGNAGESTVNNPFVPFVFRPRVKTQNSGDDIDTEQSAKNALAEELKNIKLTITTDRWEIDSKVIKPNNIITVTNPEIFLYDKTKWFIESVNLKGDNISTTATLTCVLPSVYDGSDPHNFFEEHQPGGA